MDAVLDNKITINKKLIVEDTRDYIITRIPYTQNLVKYSAKNIKWLSKNTVMVNVTDDMLIDKMEKRSSFVNGKKVDSYVQIGTYSGSDLKKHYDEVVKKHGEYHNIKNIIDTKDEVEKTPTVAEQARKLEKQIEGRQLKPKTQQASDELADIVVLLYALLDYAIQKMKREGINPEQVELSNKNLEKLKDTLEQDISANRHRTITGEDVLKFINNPEEKINIFRHEEVETRRKEEVKKEVSKYGAFEINTYVDDRKLRYYPNQLKKDNELQKMLAYKTVTEMYINEYSKSNDSEKQNKVIELEEKVKAIDSLIYDKVIRTIKIVEEKNMETTKLNFEQFATMTNVNEFKKYPIELQRDENFRNFAVTKNALENYRGKLVHAIENNANYYKQCVEENMSKRKLSRVADKLYSIEKIVYEKIAETESKLEQVNMVIDSKVSKYQEVKPRIYDLIEDRIKTMKINNLDSLEVNEFKRQAVRQIDKGNSKLHIYQFKDSNDCFIGKQKNKVINKISNLAPLRTIRNTFKNIQPTIENHQRTLTNKIESPKKVVIQELSIH